MPTRLDHIVAATRRRVSETRHSVDLHELEKRAELHVPRGFRQHLQQGSESGIAVIAELKKASPSRGLIRANFDAAGLSKELEVAGASALSVLTNEEFFQGSLENLRIASQSTSLPCLRKDFIVDEIQIFEARANHADAVLLIVAALTQEELVSLASRASELNLDVLCETHDEDELARAVDAGCDLIGVNSRDLRTFEVDMETAFKLATHIPSSVVSVAESGIHSSADIAQLRAAGYQAFLIGESLMKAEEPGVALRNLMSEARVSSL
jgi:indole-3-glycerol phosphate synthase